MANEYKNYYKILDINSKATPEELKKAYHKIALKFHPDKNKEPGSSDKFIEIQEAYEKLLKGDAPAEQVASYFNSKSSNHKDYFPFDPSDDFTKDKEKCQTLAPGFKQCFKKEFAPFGTKVKKGFAEDDINPFSMFAAHGFDKHDILKEVINSIIYKNEQSNSNGKFCIAYTKIKLEDLKNLKNNYFPKHCKDAELEHFPENQFSNKFCIDLSNESNIDYAKIVNNQAPITMDMIMGSALLFYQCID